jgi:hypothetical protein
LRGATVPRANNMKKKMMKDNFNIDEIAQACLVFESKKADFTGVSTARVYGSSLVDLVARVAEAGTLLDLFKRQFFYVVPTSDEKLRDVLDRASALGRVNVGSAQDKDRVNARLAAFCQHHPRLAHGIIGLTTEVAEKWEMVLNNDWPAGQAVLDQLALETFDSLWYVLLDADSLYGPSGPGRIVHAGLAKLRARYASAPTGADRDTPAEDAAALPHLSAASETPVSEILSAYPGLAAAAKYHKACLDEMKTVALRLRGTRSPDVTTGLCVSDVARIIGPSTEGGQDDVGALVRIHSPADKATDGTLTYGVLGYSALVYANRDYAREALDGPLNR